MVNSVFLLDFSETLENINNRVQAFLDKYYENPLFWVILCLLIFGLAAWAIGYFNKK